MKKVHIILITLLVLGGLTLMRVAQAQTVQVSVKLTEGGAEPPVTSATKEALGAPLGAKPGKPWARKPSLISVQLGVLSLMFPLSSSSVSQWISMIESMFFWS